MKRKFALLLTAALTVSCLAGCGNSVGNGNGGDVQTSSTVSETADKGKKENITLTFGTHQSGIPSCGVVQDLAAQFEEETGIKVDFQISPDAPVA